VPRQSQYPIKARPDAEFHAYTRTGQMPLKAGSWREGRSHRSALMRGIPEDTSCLLRTTSPLVVHPVYDDTPGI
jgi:hypothetical protein